MIASDLVAALEEIAARLNVPVRYEVLEPSTMRRRPRGGLCRVRGRAVILLDVNLAPPERLVILAQALASLDLSGLELTPAVRAALRAHGHGVLAEVEPRPLARTRRKKSDDD